MWLSLWEVQIEMTAYIFGHGQTVNGDLIFAQEVSGDVVDLFDLR